MKVGDIVRVRYRGSICSTYIDMFKKFNFRNQSENHCNTGDVGVVIGVDTHGFKRQVLLAVEFGSHQAIILHAGVEVIDTFNNPFSDYQSNGDDAVDIGRESGHYWVVISDPKSKSTISLVNRILEEVKGSFIKDISTYSITIWK